jgi:DNA-binding transcriptional ArsR family regulator
MNRHAAPSPVDQLGRTLAALADPTRRSILEQLSLGPASVGELARPYDMSQPAVSKHVRVLERAGLVSQAPGGRLGPRRLELAPFAKAAEWMNAYASIWSVRLKHFTGRSRRQGGRGPASSKSRP